MNIEKFHSEDLQSLIAERKIVTMPEMMERLGTQVRHTVIRKLKSIEPITSYSHKGAYYTLASVADFDQRGFWSFNHVQFSRHGNLLDTLCALITNSQRGYFLNELESILQVELRNPLLKLIRDKKIKRGKLEGRYLYQTIHSSKAREQFTNRKSQDTSILFQSELEKSRIEPEELKAAIILFFSILNERHRRLYAGLESLRIGHGGDQRVAEFFGISTNTVSKGKTELLERDIEIQGVRKKGAGRKNIKKNARSY